MFDDRSRPELSGTGGTIIEENSEDELARE
jgi:hypothetical protein